MGGKRLLTSWKRYTDYREITPQDDPRTFAPDWLVLGPRNFRMPEKRLDQPMQDLAHRLSGHTRIPLEWLGVLSKRHKVALYRHWEAGRVKFEIASREVVEPIRDENGEPIEVENEDGEVTTEERYTEEETFISPTPQLWDWWDEVVAQSGATTQPAAADTNGTARQEMDVAPREESLSDRLQRLEKTLDAIRSDPRYDGTVLGTGGFIDKQPFTGWEGVKVLSAGQDGLRRRR